MQRVLVTPVFARNSSNPLVQFASTPLFDAAIWPTQQMQNISNFLGSFPKVKAHM